MQLSTCTTPNQPRCAMSTAPPTASGLHALVEEGKVLASGPFTDGAGALLIFTAADEDELNSLLKQDPLAVGGGISGLKTTEWKPVTGAFAHLAG